ncbi:hypothetical protein L1049_024159 [Liquidambar formosana]|uniref:Uncharacterized protein n=1 Tax=Liquidambar formosana TaxID=63359 RepID=A0AAP0WZC9_LIQFO
MQQQTLDSYDVPVEQNPRLELNSKQNWAPGSTARGGISGKFPRSHSTGHSLVQPGESLERYTLRLPEEVRRQIVMSKKLKRTTSCGVVLPREGSSRRGWWKGGEGSSRGKGNSDRYVGRFDRVGRSDRWVFSMAPPFLSRVASIPRRRVVVTEM